MKSGGGRFIVWAFVNVRTDSDSAGAAGGGFESFIGERSYYRWGL